MGPKVDPWKAIPDPPGTHPVGRISIELLKGLRCIPYWTFPGLFWDPCELNPDPPGARGPFEHSSQELVVGYRTDFACPA